MEKTLAVVAGARPGDPRPLLPLQVMIVEDDAIIASLFADILEDAGYQVCATEATEAGAVAAAAKHRPGLMIVDAGLSMGSGTRAMERILQTGFVPHVFVSGDDLRGRSLHIRAAVVQKPFLEADFLRAIERALAR